MANDERIEDIALFFSENGEERRCWVTHKLYTDDEYLIGAPEEGWLGAVVQQQMTNTDPYIIANLANLDPPGEPPSDKEAEELKQRIAKKKPKAAKPGPGDLVIIPFSEPEHAYLIPAKVYRNKELCKPISEVAGADFRFMANTEGVVLANIPKIDLAGMTCYLLNLRALRKPPYKNKK